MKIGFVACNRNARRFREDASYVYRCENLAAALREMGHEVVLLHQSSLPWSRQLDLAVFHRPRHTLAFRALVQWLRLRGTRLVADVDDLVFDPAHAAHSPGVLHGLQSLEVTRQRFHEHRQALACIGAVTVSTRPLAQQLHGCLPAARVAVLPNAVHHRWRLEGEGDHATEERERIVSYLPGTRSHDRDFAVYAPALSTFLARHPAVRLEVTGPLDFHLDARPGQVRHREKLPFEQYHQRVRQGWINLAPLKRSPFTECKSALKVLEAGFWGRPTIASRIDDAERFVGDGVLFAEDAQQCLQWLETLLDPQYYARVCLGLRERVLAAADVHAIAVHFLEFVGDGNA